MWCVHTLQAPEVDLGCQGAGSQGHGAAAVDGTKLWCSPSSSFVTAVLITAATTHAGIRRVSHSTINSEQQSNDAGYLEGMTWQTTKGRLRESGSAGALGACLDRQAAGWQGKFALE